jgi:hypothetical protein
MFWCLRTPQLRARLARPPPTTTKACSSLAASPVTPAPPLTIRVAGDVMCRVYYYSGDDINIGTTIIYVVLDLARSSSAGKGVGD